MTVKFSIAVGEKRARNSTPPFLFAFASCRVAFENFSSPVVGCKNTVCVYRPVIAFSIRVRNFERIWNSCKVYVGRELFTSTESVRVHIEGPKLVYKICVFVPYASHFTFVVSSKSIVSSTFVLLEGNACSTSNRIFPFREYDYWST